MGIDPGEKRWEKVFDGFSKYRSDHSTSWLVNQHPLICTHAYFRRSCCLLAGIISLTANRYVAMTTGQLYAE